jgi:hypothetical protein
MEILSDQTEPESAKPPLPRTRAAQSNDDRKTYMPTGALVKPNLQPYSTKNGFQKGTVLVSRVLDLSNNRAQANLLSPQAEPRHGS